MLQINNILLTGSSGFLGGYFLDFLSTYHNVFTLNKKVGDYILDLSTSKPVFHNSFDIVIHCAGLAHVASENKKMSELLFDVNLQGTSNLLKGLSENLPLKQFVFISSVCVYGLNYGIKIDEDAQLIAQDPYGKSKIEAEVIVKKWCYENNVICSILRLPLLVGTNPPGNLGAMINAIRNNFYFNISDGVANKSMVLASDVAKHILKLAEIGGTYNLTDGYHPNFNELSHCIAKQINKNNLPNLPMLFAKILAFIGDTGVPKFPINSNKLNKITSTLTFDDSKARKAFGWNPTPVLKEFKIDK
jgi:nucleoside-diphosphate-sugar epimerase